MSGPEIKSGEAAPGRGRFRFASPSLRLVSAVCYYHAGCPDGFGAAWAVRRAWGEKGRYEPRGHDDELELGELRGATVAFVDLAPCNAALRALATVAERIVVLDHHVSSRTRFCADPDLAQELRSRGHLVHFELEHSGAILAWRHFHAGEPAPDLLAYVEDQDLWRFKLPRSREVNAALAAHPRSFEAWDRLVSVPIEQLAEQGAPILHAQLIEVERAVASAQPVWIGDLRLEAVNASSQRAQIGHELALRAAFGTPAGAVYRLAGRRVDVSLYSIGEFDVSQLAARFGGGGHRNAAGFSVPLDAWVQEFA
jgi:oligoribonuclease NrnB/cAMP/cGMP phosphodiesterase (DHH superfamily)